MSMLGPALPLARQPAERPYLKDDRVSLDDLSLAAEWLRANEGDDGELDACHRVADLLDRMVGQRNRTAGRERALRKVAANKGVNVSTVRRVLRAKAQRQPPMQEV